MLHCIENRFAVFTEAVKRKSWAWAVLNKTREKHARANLTLWFFTGRTLRAFSG